MANRICWFSDRSAARNAVVGAVALIVEYRRYRRECRKARRCFPLLCADADLFAMPVVSADTAARLQVLRCPLFVVSHSSP